MLLLRLVSDKMKTGSKLSDWMDTIMDYRVYRGRLCSCGNWIWRT